MTERSTSAVQKPAETQSSADGASAALAKLQPTIAMPRPNPNSSRKAGRQTETTAKPKAKLSGDNSEDDQATVANLARKALNKADGNVLLATEIMVGYAKENRELYFSLTSPLLRTACYDAVAGQCRKQKRAIWHAAQPSEEEQRGRVIALSRGTLVSLMDFPLLGGLRLGDASREDVVAAADFYAKQSKDMGHKARWLQHIAQHVTGKKSVKQCLTEERLAALKDEVTK